MYACAADDYVLQDLAHSIACDECDQWLHKTCIGMSTTEFSRLGNSNDTWKCPNCAAPINSSIIYSSPQLDESNTNEQIINQSEHPSLIQIYLFHQHSALRTKLDQVAKDRILLELHCSKTRKASLKATARVKLISLTNSFARFFTKDDGSTIPDKSPSNINSMNDITVTENGVFKLLKNLDTNKTAGPDEIPTKILQITAAELLSVLTKIFQFSLDTGEVPQDWRDANIVPLYKKGDTHLAANYPPSLVSC
ncbi:unnamed protein product [Mytilus coruscus]|uniref:PHD-type domain-containing protein n=1 Tax=Mytilus coruscus TaxID=42192 RepID=A0A6J8E9P8_MYTCO|nr:unnamed protein product [Mytilus coruscus]